jgi:hypothetical protein
VGDLAFNAAHPRFWGDVILLESSALQQPSAALSSTTAIQAPRARASDGTYTVQPDVTIAAQTAQLFRAMQANTRSDPATGGTLDATALAGLLAPVDGSLPLVYLPVGMPGIVADDDFSGPGPGSAGSDDLDSFDGTAVSLFVDSYLVPQPGQEPVAATALMAMALDRYFVQNILLHGMHSLLFVDEVAMICAPDAAHRHWQRADTPAPTLPSPPAGPPASTTPPCPPVGPFMPCQQPPTVSGLSPWTGPTGGGTAVTVSGTGFAAAGVTSVLFDGSAATDVLVISSTLVRCTTPQVGLAGPVTVAVVTATGTGSMDNAFIYTQPSMAATLPVLTAADAFALADGPLLPIQQALIALCQARADAVGILSLPGHFTADQCIAWQQLLRQQLLLPDRSSILDDARETADLSYVAVYHPWLLTADAGSPDGVRPIACDGAVCGSIAARERVRQVWVAPANVPLQGVLGLTPVLSVDDWTELFAQQFNLIRAEPRDFRAMSAHTLSDDRSLLQLSVRRLLIVLRKAALAQGMDYVFETNHERFREGVRVALIELLQVMFEGGAFAGAVPAASYHVVTDQSVNPPQSIDQGRFIAQIQVAPSQPLEFLTVQLVRTGAGLLQATEA